MEVTTGKRSRSRSRHQDQVIEPPADARVVGGSPFTPNGTLAYGTDGFSFQCHPEFTPEFAAALIDWRRSWAAGSAEGDALGSTGDVPEDRARAAQWIRGFLTQLVDRCDGRLRAVQHSTEGLTCSAD